MPLARAGLGRCAAAGELGGGGLDGAGAAAFAGVFWLAGASGVAKGGDADDAAIVTGIIALAHSLRLEVVAEGVETPAQLEWVQTQGIGQYQGYLFSRPLPVDALESYLQQAG